MFKKIIVLILSLILVLGLFACSGDDNPGDLPQGPGVEAPGNPENGTPENPGSGIVPGPNELPAFPV